MTQPSSTSLGHAMRCTEYSEGLRDYASLFYILGQLDKNMNMQMARDVSVPCFPLWGKEHKIESLPIENDSLFRKEQWMV